MNLFSKITKAIYYRLKKRYINVIIRLRDGQRLKKLKNKYCGKRCFIIGNGPSLKIEDLKKLNRNKEYSFAAHKIFTIFDETDWRPDFYCIQDELMIKTELQSLSKCNNIKYKFINGKPLVSEGIFWKNWLYFYINCLNYYPNLPKFSDDISKRIYEGWTVTYAEIQIAIYMGFREIYLLGVDHQYSKTINNRGEVVSTGKQDYFSNKYTEGGEFGKNINYPNLENSTLAYKAAKQYADMHGIKIYNATRGGNLEIFERVDFDSLFSN
jgi:hypothetical protein